MNQGIMSEGPGVELVGQRASLARGKVLETNEYLVTINIVPHQTQYRVAVEP